MNNNRIRHFFVIAVICLVRISIFAMQKYEKLLEETNNQFVFLFYKSFCLGSKRNIRCPYIWKAVLRLYALLLA